MAKVYVDKDLCIGCGLCSDSCPSVYAMEDDGKAVVISDEAAAADMDCAREGASLCPTEAIIIEE